MQLERFNFKEFTGNIAVLTAGGGRVFELAHKPKEEPVLPPPPPTFSADELKDAERQGYQKGFLDGSKEGHAQAQSEQADIEKILSEGVEKFTASVAPLLADYRAMALQLQQDLPQLALAIARKVAGDALGENGAQQVEQIALRWAETMIHEPKLTITVNDKSGDTLEQKLQNLNSASDITVLRDPAMATTDCRIDWKHGSMTHSTAQLWQQVENVVNNMTQTAKRDTTEQLDKLEAQLLPAPETIATAEIKE